MRILIFGLPGSGKTTFAKALCKDKDIVHLNGDEVRAMYKDWEFGEQARIDQANRMKQLSFLTKKHVVVDFVCPYHFARLPYDLKIWMNTIKKGKFENTNKIFQKPPEVDFEIKDYNYDKVIKKIHDRLE